MKLMDSELMSSNLLWMLLGVTSCQRELWCIRDVRKTPQYFWKSGKKIAVRVYIYRGYLTAASHKDCCAFTVCVANVRYLVLYPHFWILFAMRIALQVLTGSAFVELEDSQLRFNSVSTSDRGIWALCLMERAGIV